MLGLTSIRHRLLATHLLVAGAGLLALAAVYGTDRVQHHAWEGQIEDAMAPLRSATDGIAGLTHARRIESRIRLADSDEAREALALVWTTEIRPATDRLLARLEPAEAGEIRHLLDELKDAQLASDDHGRADSLSSVLARFLVAEIRAHAATTEAEVRATPLEDALALTAILLAAGMIGIAWLLATRTARELVEPLDGLRHAARAFAAGERYQRIKVQSRDEISNLARTLDGIIISIQESTRLMKANEARLRAIVETAPDAILTLDDQGDIQSINPSGRAILRGEDDDLVAQPVETILPPPGNETIMAYIEARMEGSATSQSTELEAIDQMGRQFPALVSIGGTCDRSWLFTLILRDISERVEAERELADALDQAKAATKAKTAFIANVTHELRTPLTGILGYSHELLGGEMGEDEREAAARIIHQSGEHLLHLINDILDFSKIDASKIVVERIPCSPSQIVDDALTWIGSKVQSKELELRVDRDPDTPESIYSDPTRLRQILLNLLGNAVKFTDSGTISLSVRPLAGPTGPSLELSVTDTGVGMTEEQMARLFAPFSQADASTTRRFGGTGLGLAISRTLCEALGGSISATSTPGVGSTFVASVAADPAPVDHDASTIDAPPARREIERLDGQRILLAEDIPVNQMLARRLLEKLGAEMTVVENGREAVDEVSRMMASGETFDAILMDLHMPEMDGYEATRELRNRSYAGLILALTANAMEQDRIRALEAGCDDFATKPIDLPSLVGKITAGRPADDAAA